MRGASFFSASHISEAVARETLNRVNSYNAGRKLAQTPKGQEMARNFTELGKTYPNVPFKMNAYQAMAGTQDDDAVAFATAMRTAEILAAQKDYELKPVTQVGGLKRAFQVGMLGLDSMFQPVSRGFKSAVVAAQETGKSVPGTVALATLAGIPEIFIGDRGEGGGAVTQGILNAVLGDGAGDKYRQARDLYGPTELTRYIQEKNKGNPINLGDGFMPNSVDLTKTQEYLNAIRAGESQQVAYNKAKAIYGRDITNAFDQAEDRFKYTTKRGEKINISPGRIIASTMTNPGSTGYSIISGLIDGVFRVAADPMNLALMYGAGTKTAMRTMLDANKAATRLGTPAYKNAQFWKGFLPGKTGKENRALFYGKTADEVLTTEWGMKFTRALADLSGDEGLAFLRDIKEFDRLPVSVLQVLNEVDDPLHIKQILETVAKAGRLTDQNYDDMFNIIKEYLPKNKQIELDNVRQLTASNKNLGLKVLPYKPTAYGEFFNYMNKIITGKTTDVAPFRKLWALGAKDNPVRALLGAGQQAKLKIPKHMQRALALRPETMVMITELDNSVKNIDNMLKTAFVDPKTRGEYIREGLQATSQTQLDDLVNRANMDIAGSIIDNNPNLKFDVEEIVKQQENFSAQMEELRSFFSGTAGSLAFNGTKIKKRYKTLIKDIEEYYKRVGIKDFNKADLERYVYEAVPTMHLLSQASGSFSLLMDPQDILRASKAHQQLVGPEESLLKAWAKNFGLIEDKDWVKEFKIPRRAYEGQSTLKPQGYVDKFFNDAQNNFLKPLWMIRLALLLRVVPEEGLRNAYANNVNPFTKFLTRLSLTSNKYYEFFNIDRAESVARIWNNTGELVMSTQMKPDDIAFMLKVLDESDVAALNAMDYEQAQKLMKHYLLETNYSGEVSEYMVNAAVNNFDIRDVKFAELTEKTFNAKTKTIKAEAKGAIKGYDGKTYGSMGEAILETGGFSVDLSKQGFIDLGYRGPAEGDVFVSAYKNKEMQIGNIGDIEKEAAKYGVTPAEYLDTQIDNLFFDDDTVALLSKDRHAMGVYTDNDGNIMLDVAVGLSGDNAVTNAAVIGMNAFQESIYVANRQLAIDAGFGKALGNGDNANLIILHYVEEGKGAKSINYDSVINKPALEALFKSNFDALKITVDEVKGAAQGLPGGSLMNNTPEYMSSMGEQAVTAAFKTGRKDLIENMYIQIDKYIGQTKEINPRYWEALWSEIELLASDPIAVRVANMGVDEAFTYFRNQGSEIIEDLVARSFNAEDKIYALKNAAGDKALKEYLESVQYRIARLIDADHQILDPVTGIPLSAEAARKVGFKDGYKVYPKFTSDLNTVQNSQILEMIKTGGVLNRKDWIKWKQHNQLLKGNSARTGGKSIKGQANQAFYKELIEVLTPEVDKAGLGPTSLPAKFDGSQRISESGTMIVGDKIVAAGFFDDANYNPGLMGGYKKLVDTAYDSLLAKPSSRLNRDPLFRYAFYENAIEAMAYMDDATRAEFLKGAEAWVDGNKLWDQLIEAAKQPAVENTITSLKQAEDILKVKAMEEVKTILYSTNQRHMASDLFSKYIPFPEIWAEVFQSWGKLIQENPQKFNKTRIAIDNGETAKPWDSENGFLEEDPRTGKMMFSYVDALNILTFGVGGRALKAVAQNRAFGEDLEEEGVRLALPGYASGLNLIAQNGFAPGFGPLVTIPANIIANAMPVPKNIQDFFLGSFGRGNPFEQWPAWAQKFLTREETFSAERQAQFGTAVMDTYTAFVLAGKVDQTDQQSIDKHMELAFEHARKLFIFRGTTQFTLPTGIQPRIEVEDKEGTWWTTQALKAKYDELLIKNGYDYMQTDIDFEQKFGINPIPLTQAKNQSMGKKPVKEHSYFWWNEDNRKDLLRPGALPNTGVYIQPDKIEDDLYYPAFYEIESQNLEPYQYAEFMQQSQAIFELEKKKVEIRNTEPERNWEDAYAEAKRQIQDEYGIENIYNYVGKQQRAKTETIIGELEDWSNYELTKNSPEYPFVVEYLQRRNELLDVFIGNGNYSYTNRNGVTETLRIRGSQRTKRVLIGDSDDYLNAQELMRFIWEDIVAKSEGTNFRQLANEVLFYEISPVNPANIKDR